MTDVDDLIAIAQTEPERVIREALDQLVQAPDDFASRISLLHALSIARLQLADYEGVRALVETVESNWHATATNYHFAEMLRLEVLVCVLTGEPQKAVERLTRVWPERDDDVPPRLMAASALAYASAGDHSGAAELFEQALERGRAIDDVDAQLDVLINRS
ncbi:MAG: hypothetical protein ACR2P0_14895, partial [Acidimicrobiales bacterium]